MAENFHKTIYMVGSVGWSSQVLPTCSTSLHVFGRTQAQFGVFVSSHLWTDIATLSFQVVRLLWGLDLLYTSIDAVRKVVIVDVVTGNGKDLPQSSVLGIYRKIRLQWDLLLRRDVRFQLPQVSLSSLMNITWNGNAQWNGLRQNLQQIDKTRQRHVKDTLSTEDLRHEIQIQSNVSR